MTNLERFLKQSKEFTAGGRTAAHAICLTALKAVGLSND